MLSNIEFYITPNGEVMINSTAAGVRKFEASDRVFVRRMMDKIEQLYPESLKALSSHYQKLAAVPAIFEFTIVRRFIKCNFGEYDSVMDIDQFGNFNFEEVSCPMRGECPLEDIACKPKFNSKLSDREFEIMRLRYDGVKLEEIAEKLFISVDTVRTHKRNAFRRVGAHTLPEFNLYARKNNLFNN